MNLPAFERLLEKSTTVAVSTQGYCFVRVQPREAISWFRQAQQWVSDAPNNHLVWVSVNKISRSAWIAQSEPVPGENWENFIVEAQ